MHFVTLNEKTFLLMDREDIAKLRNSFTCSILNPNEEMCLVKILGPDDDADRMAQGTVFDPDMKPIPVKHVFGLRNEHIAIIDNNDVAVFKNPKGDTIYICTVELFDRFIKQNNIKMMVVHETQSKTIH